MNSLHFSMIVFGHVISIVNSFSHIHNGSNTNDDLNEQFDTYFGLWNKLT